MKRDVVGGRMVLCFMLKLLRVHPLRRASNLSQFFRDRHLKMSRRRMASTPLPKAYSVGTFSTSSDHTKVFENRAMREIMAASPNVF